MAGSIDSVGRGEVGNRWTRQVKVSTPIYIANELHVEYGRTETRVRSKIICEIKRSNETKIAETSCAIEFRCKEYLSIYAKFISYLHSHVKRSFHAFLCVVFLPFFSDFWKFSFHSFHML